MNLCFFTYMEKCWGILKPPTPYKLSRPHESVHLGGPVFPMLFKSNITLETASLQTPVFNGLISYDSTDEL